MGAILEALVESAPQSKNLVHLVEAVRQSFGRGLVHSLLDREGELKVLMLEQAIESELIGAFDPQSAGMLLGDGSRTSGMPSDFLRRLVDSVKRLTVAGAGSALPVLLCPSPARYHVRRWLEPFLPKMTVLSPMEIPPEVRVRSIGTVG
jgi:flagellar biosynthesis protein FlhA